MHSWGRKLREGRRERERGEGRKKDPRTAVHMKPDLSRVTNCGEPFTTGRRLLMKKKGRKKMAFKGKRSLYQQYNSRGKRG